MQEAQEFWEAFGVQENLDPVSAAGRIKIRNLHAQPSESHLAFLIRLKRRIQSQNQPIQGS